MLRGRSFLLVKRGKAPDAGLWGFPGGHVEPGESAASAATRELREETLLRALALDQLAVFDVIRPGVHYRLTAVRCRWIAGHPVAADDAAAARWIPVAAIFGGALPMSRRVPHLARIALRQAGIRRR